MNMAYIGIIIFIAAAHFTAGNADFTSLQCKSEYVGLYGQQSMLECVVETSEDITHSPTIMVVTWKKIGVERSLVYYQYQTNKPRYSPRFTFAEPAWDKNNLNVSLLITDTTVEDRGMYECYVITSSGTASKKTVLTVSAKYKKPTITPKPETLHQNSEGTLECISDGGYPEGKIRWFGANGVEWTSSAAMEAKQTTNGMYQLSSKLLLKRGSIFSPYTCVVYNSSGGKEDEIEFSVPDVPESGKTSGEVVNSVSKVVAPLVVIGSLIVGLLVVLLYRRRARRERPYESDDREAEQGMVPVTEKQNNLA